MAQVEIVKIMVKIPKGAGKSKRISQNFALNHIDSSTGWEKDDDISLFWTGEVFSSLQLRIKNDKAGAIDTDWQENTEHGTTFYKGKIKDLNSKTKVYFATQDSVAIAHEGHVAIVAMKH